MTTQGSPAGILRVPVTEELSLLGGRWSLSADEEGQPLAVVAPPEVPMFRQVVQYLGAKPVPPGERLRLADEARAAAAVCLRWGSYLALVADPARSFAPGVGDPQVSQLHDEEMARMNVEISAAVAWWLALAGSDEGRYWDLVHRALAYLPTGPKTVQPLPRDKNHLLACSLPEAALLAQSWAGDLRDRLLPVAIQHGVRALANTITLAAWRNGPVEDVHAGLARGYGLDQRRLLPGEERAILGQAQRYLHAGLKAAAILRYDHAWPPPPERVLPFLHPFLHPGSWSYAEESRTVRLPLMP